MPVYMFTYHAYRTWNADHKRGFVQEGKGIQPPNEALARAYDAAAKQAPVRFETAHQRIMAWIAYDACQRRGWRLHMIAHEPTHVHVLVSWTSGEKWSEVSDRLKNLMSLMLGRKLGQNGRRWFVHDGSRKRVRDRGHFEYLINEYLPEHRGLKWREKHAPPREPSASAEGYERKRT